MSSSKYVAYIAEALEHDVDVLGLTDNLETPTWSLVFQREVGHGTELAISNESGVTCYGELDHWSYSSPDLTLSFTQEQSDELGVPRLFIAEIANGSRPEVMRNSLARVLGKPMRVNRKP